MLGSTFRPSKKRLWSTAISILVVISVVLFFYYDKHDSLSRAFRAWGIIGIIIAIILMAILCITPIPSESLLILYLKIYGVTAGTLYSWLGSILSSLIVFFIARLLGKPVLRAMITDARFDLVDKWIQDRGTMGLFLVRLLPIPGFVVSYFVGTIPSIGLWSFTWTAAVSVIPYYIAIALIYLGFSTGLVAWAAGGFGGLLLVGAVVYMVRKRYLDRH